MISDLLNIINNYDKIKKYVNNLDINFENLDIARNCFQEFRRMILRIRKCHIFLVPL